MSAKRSSLKRYVVYYNQPRSPVLQCLARSSPQCHEGSRLNHGPALILLSGGLDSVTALAWSRTEGYCVREALSFTYGQRHAREVESAAAIADRDTHPGEITRMAPSAPSNPAPILVNSPG